MGLCIRSTKRLFYHLVLGLATACISVLGGPDHAILDTCHNLYRFLHLDQRHVARDAIQGMQAVESYLGHLRLGRPLPLSSVPAAAPSIAILEEWKAQNASKLQSMLEKAGVAGRLGVSANATTALTTACLSSRLLPDGYAGRPTVSIILNYFKRPQVVSRLAANMRATCASVSVPCELVVNVDNPEETVAWANEGGFVVPVFSANLHEARGYNRAARLARGKYLVIWQDDQVPPPDGKWLVDMIKVFDAYPQLAILGMNCYRLCKHHEPTNRWGWSRWEPDPVTGVRWTYAQTVDFAPMAIRASIYEAVGGLDEGMSRRGDCGIWGDWELSTRVWLDGWQLGFMFLEGRAGDGEPGTTHKGANGEKCWGRQQHVAMHVYDRRYGAKLLQDPMCDRVWLLNMLTFKVGQSGSCPYNTDETRWANCTELPADVAAAAAEEFAQVASAAAAQSRTSVSGGGGLSDLSGGGGGGGGGGADVGSSLGPGTTKPQESTAGAEQTKTGETNAEAQATGSGGDQGGMDAANGTDGLLGIMDINPILVRAAGSAAGRRSLGHQ